MGRLLKRRLMSGTQLLLKKAKPFIGSMADRMNLPQELQLDTLHLLKEYHEKKEKLEKETDASTKAKELMGNEIEVQAAICLALACKRRNASRTFKEISAVSAVSIEKINRYYTRMSQVLKIHEEAASSNGSSNQNWVDSLVPRFCGILDLSNLEGLVTHIANKASKVAHVAGRKPSSIVATSIYLACIVTHNKQSAKEIGEVCGTAEPTIKLIYRILQKDVKSLLPVDFNVSTAIQRLSKH